MKRKFGTILEREIIRKLKKRAADEERPVNQIVGEALTQYLSQLPTKEEAVEAWVRLDSKPVCVSKRELQDVLALDTWEQ
ncbi:MAG TPA: hypothetical protein VGQ81_01025 [Acidobacteriota bacterium]|jgi:predicted transcriptional regulator|nr:hypothetical protein [Acidobacteriota bacterium]